jgi:hypothetical protein
MTPIGSVATMIPVCRAIFQTKQRKTERFPDFQTLSHAFWIRLQAFRSEVNRWLASLVR